MTADRERGIEAPRRVEALVEGRLDHDLARTVGAPLDAVDERLDRPLL